MSFGHGLKSRAWWSAKQIGGRLFDIRTKRNMWLQNAALLLFGSGGGFLLSRGGLSVGWMIGTMLALGFLSLQKQQAVTWLLPERGLHPIWKQAGQLILAVQVGQQMTGSLVHLFAAVWLPVALALVLSLLSSVLLGLLLWRYSGDSLLTSLYAITPGGISNMPTIAQEVGANAITVSIIQTLRLFLVVSIIPFFAREWRATADPGGGLLMGAKTPTIVMHSWLWTGCLLLAALLGTALGKRCNLPAPRLVGGMIGVALVQFFATWLSGADLMPWFPGFVKVLAQIFLGASIGASLRREMFARMGKTVLVGLLSALCLVLIMLACAFGVARLTGIPLITSILAFAPGGVAEMAVTAIALKANASFVVAVQTLRLLLIFFILPPLFRVLSIKWGQRS